MGVRLAIVVGAIALVSAVLAGIWLLALRGGGGSADRRTAAPAHRSYAQLVKANYRILSPAQSRRLLRFAHSFSSCVSRKGIGVGRPEALATKIVMAVPAGVPPVRLARLAVTCGDALGGPPKEASLVRPKHGKTIELYLPKQCLLDRKVIGSAGRASG